MPAHSTPSARTRATPSPPSATRLGRVDITNCSNYPGPAQEPHGAMKEKVFLARGGWRRHEGCWEVLVWQYRTDSSYVFDWTLYDEDSYRYLSGCPLAHATQHVPCDLSADAFQCQMYTPRAPPGNTQSEINKRRLASPVTQAGS